MILCFELSMPNVGSWNGQWSGEGRYYAVTRTVKDADALPILNEGYYHYSFGDGWAAGVTVRCVDAASARRARSRSAGFCGYEWMVDSILRFNTILNRSQQATVLAARAGEEAAL